jgi:lipopolysaccharide/colanic/teichoic acid biosynthesis glycosyltransferase
MRDGTNVTVVQWEPLGPTGGGGGYVHVKCAIEWVVALGLFLLVLPLLVALAALVALTSEGPIAYSQERLGRAGKTFRIYKLRTMTHGCEAETGPVWSVANDPRVTRVGRFLRDTHLDELPQLWNVLCGHMGLIGPRPERPEIAAAIEEALPEFRERLVVRPGITGLAQMRLPADSDFETVRRKLSHDLYYIRHLSFGLDVRLAVSTPLRLLGELSLSLSRGLVRPRASRLSTAEPVGQPVAVVPTASVRIDADREHTSAVAWPAPLRAAA